jgi:hypothetical protein
MRLIVISLLFAAASSVGAQSLCPPQKSVASEAPELQMTERTFTEKAALDSLLWLENDLVPLIKRHKTTDELLNYTEGFGIPYPNSVAIIKGTVLRQRALLAQARLESANLKLKSGVGSAKDVELSRWQFAVARKEFCEFLRHAIYVD